MLKTGAVSKQNLNKLQSSYAFKIDIFDHFAPKKAVT